MNFDRQIAGTVKVAGCHTIYSDDKGVQNFAKKLGLKVVSLAQLDIPPSKFPLIDKMEELNAEKEKETTRAAENPVGLQADSAGRTGDQTGSKEAVPEKPKPAKEGGLGEGGP